MALQIVVYTDKALAVCTTHKQAPSEYTSRHHQKYAAVQVGEIALGLLTGEKFWHFHFPLSMSLARAQPVGVVRILMPSCNLCKCMFGVLKARH